MDASTPDLDDALARHTDLLLTTARSLEDPTADSLCVGWSRGHVLSHVARNADGILRVVRAAVDGTGETMYDSPDRRDADIDDGAGRSLEELVADVEDSAARLAQALPRLASARPDTLLMRTPGVPFVSARALPYMRLREVVIHHIDLDAGFGFEDVEPDLLRLFIDRKVALLRTDDEAPDATLRTTEGDEWTIGAGTTEVSGDRSAVLAWLTRGSTRGVTGDPLPRVQVG